MNCEHSFDAVEWISHQTNGFWRSYLVVAVDENMSHCFLCGKSLTNEQTRRLANKIYDRRGTDWVVPLQVNW